MTTEDLERAAYMAGDTATADLLAEVASLRAQLEAMEDKLAEAEEDIASFKKWEERNGPASDYYDFFHECFARLNGHYPCPSVTSDYDKSVIFDAISRGD